jgi:uncharacterized membrane protein
MYDVLLILHFIGLALGVGTGLANFTLGLATRDMEPAARTQFFLRAFALGKNGSYGLLLLLVTGIGMMVSRGVHATFALGGPAFHAKLTLVVVLLGLLGYSQVLMKRAKQAQGGPTMATIPKVGRVMLLTGIGIIVCAVLAFH